MCWKGTDHSSCRACCVSCYASLSCVTCQPASSPTVPGRRAWRSQKGDPVSLSGTYSRARAGPSRGETCAIKVRGKDPSEEGFAEKSFSRIRRRSPDEDSEPPPSLGRNGRTSVPRYSGDGQRLHAPDVLQKVQGCGALAPRLR